MTAAEVYVTNFNTRFTGVSATIKGLVPEQAKTYDVRLVGTPLPDVAPPISKADAKRHSRRAPGDRPFAIWHVRRDPEMRAALWARDVLRLPIKTVFTSAARHRHGAIPRWLIARQDAVIATSSGAAEFFDRVAETAPHGVDTEAFHPAEDRARAWAELGYGGTEGVAILGRIRPEKGTDIFVDAMIRACAARPGLVALALGAAKDKDAAFLKELETRVAAAGLADRILFPGFVSDARKREVLRAISLVVNVARYEPFGVVPLEGMASATPFVCSDTGFYRDFSENETTGLIVPAGDAEAASTQVLTLLSDPDRYRAMSEKALEIARVKHSIAREAGQINTVYERLWAGEHLRSQPL